MSALELPELSYECLRCGKSCRQPWRITLEPATEGFVRQVAPEAVTESGGLPSLKKNLDGCVLLRDGLCTIHADHGFDKKPRACRQFPFLVCQTPDGYAVGLSFRCNAVRTGHGPSLAEKTAELRRLVEGQPLPRRGFGSIPLRPGREIGWADYQVLEEQARQALKAGTQFSWLAEIVGRPLRPEQPRQLAINLVAFLEARDFEHLTELIGAMATGSAFTSRRGWTVEPGGLKPLRHARLEELIGRYLKQLLTRKFLLEGPSILARALVWVTLPALLRFYVGVSLQLGGREQVEESDLELAFDLLEGELVTHANAIEAALGDLEQNFLAG